MYVLLHVVSNLLFFLELGEIILSSQRAVSTAVLLYLNRLCFQTKHINIPLEPSPAVPAILTSSRPGYQTVLDRYSP